jgi:nucleotide-binding universal stress UspA family protein
MFRSILVPLDGSKLAECALPYAEELAKCCNTEQVVLISVTERVEGYRIFDAPNEPLGQRLVPEATGKQEKQAQKYLDGVAKVLKAQGVKVQTEVLLGKPAEEITLFAKHWGIDLIVMSSHGRSGPSRWAFGSVADKVSRASSVPVLMIRAPGCEVSV